jgi:hypothetical protein
MAWFLNFYKCVRCKRRWTDEWSCTCDDQCPHCGARDMSPTHSEDLTEFVEREGGEFVAIPTIKSLAASSRARLHWNFSPLTNDQVRHSGAAERLSRFLTPGRGYGFRVRSRPRRQALRACAG